MRRFLRNILCYIGFHDWEWWSERTVLSDGTSIVTDYGKCKNWRCKSHRNIIMNYERRPW